MNDDIHFLRLAVRAACNSVKEGGGPFGAVITRDGKIIAEAANRVILSKDPTAHAEVMAIRIASGILNRHDLSDCILYASCEPCPMCLGAVYWAGIKKVVYAADRSDASSAGFGDSFIYEEISLDPPQRKVLFIKHDGAGGDEPFKIWEKHEGKIPY